MDMINYLLFIATTLLLFVTFRMLRFASFRVGMLRKYYALIVAVDLSLWIAFLFWLVSHFFRYKPYYNDLVLMLVLAVVILLVWYYIKDVVAGFLFRIKHNPLVGQLMQSSEADGVIKKLSPSQVMVEKEGGKIIRIPYSKLLNGSISFDNEDVHSASEVALHVALAPGDSYAEREIKIRQALLQSPWCVPNKPIRIEATPNGFYITFHLVDKSFAETVKATIISASNEKQTS